MLIYRQQSVSDIMSTYLLVDRGSHTTSMGCAHPPPAARAESVQVGLELQGYKVGAPLPPQAPLTPAARAEFDAVLCAMLRNRAARRIPPLVQLGNALCRLRRSECPVDFFLQSKHPDCILMKNLFDYAWL
jgi:hypothetical protein